MCENAWLWRKITSHTRTPVQRSQPAGKISHLEYSNLLTVEQHNARSWNSGEMNTRKRPGQFNDYDVGRAKRRLIESMEHLSLSQPDPPSFNDYRQQQLQSQIEPPNQYYPQQQQQEPIPYAEVMDMSSDDPNTVFIPSIDDFLQEDNGANGSVFEWMFKIPDAVLKKSEDLKIYEKPSMQLIKYEPKEVVIWRHLLRQGLDGHDDADDIEMMDIDS